MITYKEHKLYCPYIRRETTLHFQYMKPNDYLFVDVACEEECGVKNCEGCKNKYKQLAKDYLESKNP